MIILSALLLMSPFILISVAFLIVVSIVCWILGIILKAAVEGFCMAVDNSINKK